MHTRTAPSDSLRAARSVVSQPREPALVTRVRMASSACDDLEQQRGEAVRSVSAPKVQQVAHVGHGVQLGRGHHELAHERLGGRALAQQILDASQVLGVRRGPHGGAVRVVVEQRRARACRRRRRRLLVAHDRRAARRQRLEQLAEAQRARWRRSAARWRTRCGRRGRVAGAPRERARGAASVPRSAARVGATRALRDGVRKVERPHPRRDHERRCASPPGGARSRPARRTCQRPRKSRRAAQLRLEDAAAPLHQRRRGLARAASAASLEVVAGRGGRRSSPAGWQKCAIGDSSAAPTLRCSSAASRCGP